MATIFFRMTLEKNALIITRKNDCQSHISWIFYQLRRREVIFSTRKWESSEFLLFIVIGVRVCHLPRNLEGNQESRSENIIFNWMWTVFYISIFTNHLTVCDLFDQHEIYIDLANTWTIHNKWRKKGKYTENAFNKKSAIAPVSNFPSVFFPFAVRLIMGFVSQVASWRINVALW